MNIMRENKSYQISKRSKWKFYKNIIPRWNSGLTDETLQKKRYRNLKTDQQKGYKLKYIEEKDKKILTEPQYESIWKYESTIWKYNVYSLIASKKKGEIFSNVQFSSKLIKIISPQIWEYEWIPIITNNNKKWHQGTTWSN